MRLPQVTYIQLHVASVKLRLKQESKLLVHDAFGALLLGTFDFLQLHITQIAREMAILLLQFQVAGVVQYFTGGFQQWTRMVLLLRLSLRFCSKNEDTKEILEFWRKCDDPKAIYLTRLIRIHMDCSNVCRCWLTRVER